MMARLAFVLSLLVLTACSGAPAGTKAPTGATPTLGAASTGTPALGSQPASTDQAGGTGVPANANSLSPCNLTTADEVTTYLGAAAHIDSMTEGQECTWNALPNAFTTLTIRFENGSLDTANLILSSPSPVTVGQFPAVVGKLMGTIVYVQIAADRQLVFQSVLDSGDAATQQKLLDLATKAVGRL